MSSRDFPVAAFALRDDIRCGTVNTTIFHTRIQVVPYERERPYRHILTPGGGR